METKLVLTTAGPAAPRAFRPGPAALRRVESLLAEAADAELLVLLAASVSSSARLLVAKAEEAAVEDDEEDEDDEDEDDEKPLFTVQRRFVKKAAGRLRVTRVRCSGCCC